MILSIRNKYIHGLFLLIAGTCLIGCGTNQSPTSEAVDTNIIELTPEANQQAHIETIQVSQKNIPTTIVSTGEIRADENKVFHVSAPVQGRVVSDRVVLGDVVRAGQTLALLQNIEVAKINGNFIHELHQNEVDVRLAQTKLSLAQKNYERETRLLAEGISSKKDYIEAQGKYEMARSELEGLQEHAVHIKSEAKALLSAYSAAPTKYSAETVGANSVLSSPKAGIVVKKGVVLGDTVMPDKVLYEIADLKQIWLDITVYPKDIDKLKLGEKVSFVTDALPQKTFRGQINYLQPQASVNGNTYIARAFLANSNLILKPGFLGQAKIEMPARIAQVFVPESAVQTYGKESFVFIPVINGNQHRYEKRTIELSNKVDGGVMVTSGLKAGETVVTNGSFTLKSIFLKNQFGGDD